jgi:hypothetical protein
MHNPLIPGNQYEIYKKMTGETAEKVSPSIGPLVLALAKTFHWAGLYGVDHPILSKRMGEFHTALLARLSEEPEGKLYLGIARDRFLYRNEFLGEGQEHIARLTESLYLRQVATLGFEPAVTPEGLLSLFRFLHESQERKTQISAEQFLRENGISGISLSPFDYKELLSRKLLDAPAPVQRENRERDLWRMLLTADYMDKGKEEKMMEDLLHTPKLLRAIFRRAQEAASRQESHAGKSPISAEVLQNIVGRITMHMKALPKNKKKEILSSLETGMASPDSGGGAQDRANDLNIVRSLVEGHTDEEFLDLVASLVSLEGKGGERLRKAFGILAGERNTGNALLHRVTEQVREKRRIKDYYAQKTWEAVERLLLSRDEERYLRDEHRDFLEDISSLRKPYLTRLGKKPLDDLGVEKSFSEREVRGKNLRILLQLLEIEPQESDFFDLLEDVRKAIPNLISLRDLSLLATVLTTLESLVTTIREDWRSRVQDVIAETDFGQIADICLSGDVPPEDVEGVHDLLAKFGGIAAPPLLDRLLIEPDPSRRRALIKFLARLGPAIVPEAGTRISHPKWYFVRNLCTILGDVGDRQALKPLMQAISHREHRVKREAILAIGKLGAPEAVRELGKILLEEGFFSSKKIDQTRIDAASALYRIGGSEAIAFLQRGAKARRFAVRSHCEGLLRSMKEPL